MSRGIVVLAGLLLAANAQWSSADAVVGTGTPASCNESALNAAVSTVVPAGGVIRFNCGGAATINTSSQKLFFWPDNPNLVYGIDGGGLITINAQGLSRHILHLSGTLNIVNITFTGGRATGDSDNASGGSIRSDRNVNAVVALNLNNVTFTNNQGTLGVPAPGLHPLDHGGGAVFTRLVNATVLNCNFTSNVCNNCSGGGLHSRSAALTVFGTTFNSNSANAGGFGGAMHVDGSTVSGTGGVLQVLSSTFVNNTSLNEGGAMFFFFHDGRGESVVLDGVNVVNNRVIDSGRVDFVGNLGFGGGLCTNFGTINIRNSTFAGNSARGTVAVNGPGLGGGASLGESDAVNIVNTTFSNNQLLGGNNPSFGGGVRIAGHRSPFQIVHSTIVGNRSQQYGGGIHGSNGVLRNTIVANNTTASGQLQQCASTLTNAGGALMWPDEATRCAGTLAIVDPELGPLASNGGPGQTHHPFGQAGIGGQHMGAAEERRRLGRAHCRLHQPFT